MTEQILVPPLNFAMVSPGIYRSGYPNKKNHPFLRTLQLRTVIHLSPDSIGEDTRRLLCDDMQAQLYHIPLDGNKEPFSRMSIEGTLKVLCLLLDCRSYPVLVHCNKGRHRVGCIMGILRKLQNWSITSIFDEYRRFAGGKIRLADQEFIELFEIKRLWLAIQTEDEYDSSSDNCLSKPARPVWLKRMLLPSRT